MIDALDHLVLTVSDMEATTRFYVDVLGFAEIHFGENRRALRCGQQKINLHVAGDEISPYAAHPQPGSADLCFLTSRPLDGVERYRRHCGIHVELGPVERSGVRGPIRSIYIRDPDENLIEISESIS